MKPITFNYQDYVKAKERIRELEAKNRKLKEENTNLRIHVRILTADLDDLKAGRHEQ